MLAYPKLLHVFAAGNDGFNNCSPFPIPFGTIKSGFRTGKNILTVGSMDNTTYTVWGPSSRGPTNDGRMKPEIVAAELASFRRFRVISSSMNGTSMASPTATGILALITESIASYTAAAIPTALY